MLNAPSGTFTYAGFTYRLDWNIGTQGWLTSSSSCWLNHAEDFATVLTNALLRVIADPHSATVLAEPRFWIREGRLRIIITNAAQVDADVVIYPWFLRKGISLCRPDLLFCDSGATNLLETHAGSTTVLGNPNELGWTPYQARNITEMVKLGKPKKFRIPGGQSVEYAIRDKKPIMLDYARLGQFGAPDGVGLYPDCAISGHFRGCFVAAQGGHAVNDTVTHSDINQSPGHLNFQFYKTYEWVCNPMPYHFNDIVLNGADIGAFSIIQPQTGVITVAPSNV